MREAPAMAGDNGLYPSLKKGGDNMVHGTRALIGRNGAKESCECPLRGQLTFMELEFTLYVSVLYPTLYAHMCPTF